MLEIKGLLHHHFTQNIDRLDLKAGVSDHKIMAAHGSSHRAICSNRMCKKEVPVNIYRGILSIIQLTSSLRQFCDAKAVLIQLNLLLCSLENLYLITFSKKQIKWNKQTLFWWWVLHCKLLLSISLWRWLRNKSLKFLSIVKILPPMTSLSTKERDC